MNPRSGPVSIGVVVPAYNEAANLPALIESLGGALARSGLRHEILVVDDGSRDATPRVLAGLARPGLRSLRLSRNFGKEAALTAGLEHVRGDVVLLIDADGQHPVALIEPMLAAWRDGADMVCAVHTDRADESLLKRFGTRAFYAVVNAGSRVRIPPDAGDFRLMDRKVVEALNRLPERTRFMKGLYAWVGFNTRFVAYTPSARGHGASRFSLIQLARLAAVGITAFSTLPLRIWSGIGVLLALLAIAYGLWVIVEHLIWGHPVPGWPTIVAGLMLFSGVQLISVGMLGTYLGRIFDEVKQRPLYVVAEESGSAAWGAPAADSPPAPAIAVLEPAGHGA